MTNVISINNRSDRRYAASWLGLVAIGCISLSLCSCQGGPTELNPPLTGGGPPAVALPAPATGSHPANATLSLSDNTPAAPPMRLAARPVPATPVVLPYAVPNPQLQSQVGIRAPALPCPPSRSAGLLPAMCGPCTAPRAQWIPPGLSPPWPQDEYLCDGGDAIPSVRVNKDWTVAGLGLEDTVVHYDTLDGQTRVEPANRVCVYAPRFAAVRKVYGVVEHESHQFAAGVELPATIRGMEDTQIATTTVQPLQPGLDRGTLTPSAFRDRTLAPILENREGVTGAQGALLPYEDFALIREGYMDNSEKARLAQSLAAAAVWSDNKAVQVLIDNIAVQADVGSNAPGSIHTYKMQGKGRLRVCKVASRRTAHPGDIVEFTLRFDNIGDQVIGNVTVIDNLTTRLAYVEGSQSCSLKANFSTTANQGDSLVLRWEIIDPLQVGKGGVIRFKCRVR